VNKKCYNLQLWNSQVMYIRDGFETGTNLYISFEPCIYVIRDEVDVDDEHEMSQ